MALSGGPSPRESGTQAFHLGRRGQVRAGACVVTQPSPTARSRRSMRTVHAPHARAAQALHAFRPTVGTPTSHPRTAHRYPVQTHPWQHGLAYALCSGGQAAWVPPLAPPLQAGSARARGLTSVSLASPVCTVGYLRA